MNEVKTFLQGKKKFLTALLGILLGISIVFGVDQGDVSTIAGAVVSVFSVCGYLVAEGKIDVERIKAAANNLNDVLEIIELPAKIELPAEDGGNGEPGTAPEDVGEANDN